MDEIEFNITNNAWINNGIIRLVIELKTNFSEKINIQLSKNSVKISSKENVDILEYINKSIKHLASTGTYNFSQALKIINKYSDANFTPPSQYPNKDEFKKEMEISEEDKKILKENSNLPRDKKQQIWKMRLSYLGSKNDYLKYGLDLKSTDVFKKLESNENSENICNNCGLISKKMLDSKQYFNPLSNEHHNNVSEVEGFSLNMRKTIKLCPNCVMGALFSLFDNYIPFYRNSRGNIFLALPNIYDFDILKKIENNLSLNSQYVDLDSPEVTNYSNNIKSLGNNKCNSAALLSLLHNIQNNYSKDQINNLFADLKEIELMSITDWIFINKESSNITEINANSNVYKILKSEKDPNNKDIYLVTDFFNKIKLDLNEAFLESFYNSFLKLDHVSMAKNLFILTKYNIDKIIDYNKGYSFYLFNHVFLDQIMGEIIMLDDKLKKACKSIAQSIGKSFYKNIGIMTKFAYATDKEVFKQYMEEVSFLMAKKSALTEENYYLNRDDLEVLFDSLDGENFKELKSYFVSFMSANAIYENYKKNKNTGKEE